MADDALERGAGAARVAGVDEVGRGPLAGPVIAAAVILDPDDLPQGLADSKTLSPARRAALYDQIMARATVGLGQASVQEIDTLNILRAAHLAMMRAIDALSPPPGHVLIDGNLLPRGLALPATAVVKGDAKSVSIAAASIIAKVTRDRLMLDLAGQFPAYGWDKNAGYPTKTHLAALQKFGITPWHRRSFKPVHNILYQEQFVTP